MDNAFFTLIPGADEYPPLRDEIDALVGEDAYDDKQHFLDYITRFVAIINDPDSVSPAMRNYLLTEGGNLALDGVPIGAPHMLYWLDRQLKTKARDEHELYTNRLSEAGAGWGEDAPDSVTEADPLDLVTVLEGLGCKVVIVDPNADPAGTNNTTAGTSLGFVNVTYGGASTNPCTTLNGTPKSSGGNADFFTTSGKDTYRHKGVFDLNSISETGGSTSCRFPNSSAHCFWLVRSADVHNFYAEAVLRRPSAHTAPASITITGYPGELPIVNAGSSLVKTATPGVLDDVTYDSVGTLNDLTAPLTARQNMILLGSVTERNNFHFRNIEWHGRRRLSDDSGWVYVSQLLEYTSLSSGSIRRCVFRHFQFIRPNDGYAAAHPNLVDAAWNSRAGDLLAISGVESNCVGFIFDSNYVEPVTKAAWPSVAANKIDNHTTFDAPWLNIDSDDCRVTRNTFRGVKNNSMLVANSAHRIYVAHNDMEVYDKTCIDIFSSNDVLVEFNRLHDYGNADVALEQGGDGVKINDCARPTVRYNVIFNHETAIEEALGIAINAHTGTPTTDARVYGNIVYRGCIRIDAGGAANVTGADIYQNICAGMTNARKSVNHFNAPINYEGTLAVGTLEGNLVRDNTLWRFTNDAPTSDTIEDGPHIAIRTTGAGNTFVVTDTGLSGWTGNVAAKPAWTGLPESDDFRITGSTLPANMPFTEALSQAWEPD